MEIKGPFVIFFVNKIWKKYFSVFNVNFLNNPIIIGMTTFKFIIQLQLYDLPKTENYSNIEQGLVSSFLLSNLKFCRTITSMTNFEIIVQRFNLNHMTSKYYKTENRTLVATPNEP